MEFRKSAIIEMPVFYDRYINLVPDLSLKEALSLHHDISQQPDWKNIEALGNKTYAEGKWTVKEILCHLTDIERIHIYRALMIARGSSDPIPAIDPAAMAANSEANSQSFSMLINAFNSQRAASIQFFESISPSMARRQGIVSQKKISVLALGFVAAGHVIHHLNIINEKYLPLLH
jgi:hypothetical protein